MKFIDFIQCIMTRLIQFLFFYISEILSNQSMDSTPTALQEDISHTLIEKIVQNYIFWDTGCIGDCQVTKKIVNSHLFW